MFLKKLSKLDNKKKGGAEEEKKEQAKEKKPLQIEEEEEEPQPLRLVDTREDAKVKHKETLIKLNTEETVLRDDGVMLDATLIKREEVEVKRTTWEVTDDYVRPAKQFNYEEEKDYFAPLGQEHLIKDSQPSRRIEPGRVPLPLAVGPGKAGGVQELSKQQQKELEMEARLKSINSAVKSSGVAERSLAAGFLDKQQGITFNDGPIRITKGSGGGVQTTKDEELAELRRKKEEEMEARSEAQRQAAKAATTPLSGISRAGIGAGTTAGPQASSGIRFDAQPPIFKKVAGDKPTPSTGTIEKKSAQQLKEEEMEQKIKILNAPPRKEKEPGEKAPLFDRAQRTAA